MIGSATQNKWPRNSILDASYCILVVCASAWPHKHRFFVAQRQPCEELHFDIVLADLDIESPNSASVQEI